MAFHYTRSKAQRPSELAPSEIEYSDVEPSDVAPVAVTSSVGLSVAAVEGPESMAIESAGPASVSIHPSPAGRPSFQGGLGVLGPAGSPQVGVSLGYHSGLAGPSEWSVRGVEQLSTPSIAMGIEAPSTAAGYCPRAAASTAAAAAAARRDDCRYKQEEVTFFITFTDVFFIFDMFFCVFDFYLNVFTSMPTAGTV